MSMLNTLTIPSMSVSGVESIPDGQSAREHGSSGRGAERVGGVEGGQEHALGGHLVKVWCLFGWVAIHSQVSPSHLVQAYSSGDASLNQSHGSIRSTKTLH